MSNTIFLFLSALEGILMRQPRVLTNYCKKDENNSFPTNLKIIKKQVVKQFQNG